MGEKYESPPTSARMLKSLTGMPIPMLRELVIGAFDELSRRLEGAVKDRDIVRFRQDETTAELRRTVSQYDRELKAARADNVRFTEEEDLLVKKFLLSPPGAPLDRTALRAKI